MSEKETLLLQNIDENNSNSDFDLEVKEPKLRAPSSRNQIKGLPKSGRGWKKESNKFEKLKNNKKILIKDLIKRQ